MGLTIKAGALYFAIVFAIGMALGALRVLVLIPAVGERAAVVIELPVMLAVSWVACQTIVLGLQVPAGIAPRAAMGGVAFALLMLGELGVSLIGFGRSIGEHVAVYRNAMNQLGLAAQIAFGLFPLLERLLVGSQRGRHDH